MAWYYTRAKSPNMEQVVIIPEGLELQKSKRMLMLTAQYLRVYKSFWTTVLFKSDDEKNPVLLIKANDSTEFLKDHPFLIGLSFIKGEYGNLFAVFVEFEGTYPFNCPTKPLVFFEDILGLDYEENRDRIRRSLNLERLKIWFAEGGNAEEENGIMSADAITITYEGEIPIVPECQKALSEAIGRHIDEHISIGPEKWDFRKTQAAFTEQLPITVSPILSEDGNVQPSSSDSATVSGEREIAYVVIFVKGDPGFTTMPDSMKDAVFERAKSANFVVTSQTSFHMFRNSADNVDTVRKGESIAMVAVMEVILSLQRNEPDEVMRLSSGCEQFYLKKSGWFGNKVPESAIVLVPKPSET